MSYAGGAVLSALLLLPQSSLAHDGNHIPRRWEQASMDPDRIFLSFMGDPATSRAVTWRTDDRIEPAYAEISEALGEPGFDKLAKRIKAETTHFNLGEVVAAEHCFVHYHSVVFKDLKPETLYAYRVGNGERIWSEWIQFRAASAEPKPFSFLYFGDAQNDVRSRWSRVIRMAYQKNPDAAFALHAGDLINLADYDEHWAQWFNAGGFLHRQYTGVPVMGNHEYRAGTGAEKGQRVMSALWRPQFTLPVEESLPEKLHETVYSFIYQGAKVIVLNSNVKVAEQIPYLEKELAKDDCRWRIVTCHHPIFSPRGRRNFRDEDRNRLMALIKKYNVDLLLQGHDHTYARGDLSVEEEGEKTFKTLCVTSVSGPKQYEIPEGQLESYAGDGYEPLRIAQNTQFFQSILIAENLLTYRAYTATGELYDEAVIEKDFSDGSKSISQKIPPSKERTYGNTAPYSKDNL